MAEASGSKSVDSLAARRTVRDLIHEYARRVRRDQPDEVAALFVLDGIFEIRDGHPDRAEHTVRSRLEGRTAINAHLAPMKGRPHPVPLIHNLMVDVDGDTAIANCVMEAKVLGTDNVVFGEYRDRCARIDGSWFFAERQYTIYSAGSSV